MKLHLSLLKKFVDLPISGVAEIKELLDDLGLEVKSFEELPQGGDVIFNLELLANRGDHHGVLGMAREIASRNLSTVKMPSIATIEGSRSVSLPLRVVTPLCLRYALLEMEVPEYLPLRPEIESTLVSASKHPIVDTLNFVQYELGQPLHAFDRDKISGEVRVESLSASQSFEALDGVTYEVPEGSIVILDGKGIIAAAGVIGSKGSAVSSETRRVLIESACFDPVAVRKTSRAMGVSTDASKVFERGSDIEGVHGALRRVVYLLSGAGGAVKGDACQVVGLADGPVRALSERIIEVSLGALREAVNSPRLPELEVEMRLKALGFLSVESVKAPRFKVKVPTWRLWDVCDEQDIIEEFVRSYGLNRIKLKPFLIEPVLQDEPVVVSVCQGIVPILRCSGFNEVITKSFYSESTVGVLSQSGIEPNCHIRLKNSLERNNSALRVSLLPALLEVAAENQAQTVETVKIYERARIYERHEEKTRETELVSFLWVGNWNAQLKEEKLGEGMRYRYCRGLISQILSDLGIEDVSFDLAGSGLFHPKIQARIQVRRKDVGVFGVVHPAIVSSFKVRGCVVYGELRLAQLAALQARIGYVEPARFPIVKRDVTVIVPHKLSAEKVRLELLKDAPRYCEKIEVYDWFEPKDEAVTRVTYRCIFRDQDRTLEGAAVDAGMEQLRGKIVDRMLLQIG
jgi:phenylalanyl-tRNA synthetase beta chain